MSKWLTRRFFNRLWRFIAVGIAAVAVMRLAYRAHAGFYIACDILGTRNVASIAPATSVAENPVNAKAHELHVLKRRDFQACPTNRSCSHDLGRSHVDELLLEGSDQHLRLYLL